MSKKRKTTKKSTAAKSSLSNWKNLSQKALLPEAVYFGFLSNLGHTLTVITLTAAVLFLLGGYLTRPTILEENLIPKLLYPEKFGDFRPLAAYPNQRSGKSPFSNYEAYSFYAAPDSPSGFVIPRKVLNIPENTQKIGLCIIAAYQGVPYIKYGFAGKEHSMEDIGFHLGGIRLELLPTPNEIKMTTMLPDYNSREAFEVPWDHAESFFFLISAKVPSDMHIIKIALLKE